MITTTQGNTKEKDIIGYTNKGGRFDEDPDIYLKGNGAQVDINNKSLFKEKFGTVGKDRLKQLIEGMYQQFSKYVPTR